MEAHIGMSYETEVTVAILKNALTSFGYDINGTNDIASQIKTGYQIKMEYLLGYVCKLEGAIVRLNEFIRKEDHEKIAERKDPRWMVAEREQIPVRLQEELLHAQQEIQMKDVQIQGLRADIDYIMFVTR